MAEKGNFTVYKSSAGSGKTFTLVKEYLRIALDDIHDPPLRYKSILAITFTNKAAGEMKERVIAALSKLSDPLKEDVMRKLLQEEMNIGREELADRSRILLNAVLHNYADFAIGTIDSFVHRIVRAFAIDLKLPLNFRIETNKEKILAHCVNELTARVGEDPFVTGVLTEFSKARAEENKNWNVEAELLGFVKEVLDENGIKKADRLKNLKPLDFLDIKKKLQEFVSYFRRTLSGMGDLASTYISSQGLEAADFFQTNKGIWNYFRKIAEEEFADDVINSYVKKTIEEGKWKSSNSRLTEEHIDHLQKRFFEIEKFRKENVQRYFTWSALLQNMYSLIVISQVEQILAGYKEEENFVFISEFNNRISGIVASEPVPFIYERIGERYQHFLLDEFQDTSVQQWQNLLPLIDNSLANGNFNLVVGDGKQSIYRWRGGEVEQFTLLPNVFGEKNAVVLEREAALQRNYSGKFLDQNFRSRKNIIEFNNRFYDWLKQHKLDEKTARVYEHQEQQCNEKNEGGYVSFDEVAAELSAEEKENEVCRMTLEKIRLNLDDCGFSLSDITVLVRNKREGKIIADFLVANNIPIVSSESLLLDANETVRAITAVLRLVSDARVHVQEAIVLRYLALRNYFAGADFSALLNEFMLSGTNLGNWLYDKKIADIRRRKLSGLPLYELCVTIIRQLHLMEQDPLFVRFFLDEVLNYSRNNRENLKAFIEWWDDNAGKLSAVLPSGTDAVSIMTIHTSKGLEFPVVILPFADWEVKKQNAVWIDLDEKQLPGLEIAMISRAGQLKETPYNHYATEEASKETLDNVNLLYVATTRPVHHLHIISRNRNDSRFADKWLREFFESDGAPPSSFYERGTRVQKQAGPSEKRKAEEHALQLRDWKEIVSMRFSDDVHPELPISDKKRAWGILFHLVMSKVHSAADVERAILWFSVNGYCSLAESALLRQKTEELFANELFARFYEPGFTAMNEPELITEEKKVLRPDRLVFFKDHVAIIDFKTGGENEEYAKQLQGYEMALHQSGFAQVKKYIVYVEENRVEELLNVN